MSDTQIDNLEMGYMFEELIRRFCRLFSKDSFRPAIMLRAMENGAWGSDYRSA